MAKFKVGDLVEHRRGLGLVTEVRPDHYVIQFPGESWALDESTLVAAESPLDALANRVTKLEAAIAVVTPEPYTAESWGPDTRVLGRTFLEWVQLIRERNEAEDRIRELEEEVWGLKDVDATAGRREAEARVQWQEQLDTHEWVTIHYGTIPGGSRRTQERKN